MDFSIPLKETRLAPCERCKQILPTSQLDLVTDFEFWCSDCVRKYNAECEWSEIKISTDK